MRRSILQLSLVGIALLSPSAKVFAGPLPTPVMTLPLPARDEHAFSTSIRYDSQGILYAWDGVNVWRQNAVNSSAFTWIGDVAPQGVTKNSSDTGPITFSQDGTRLLLGNGGGGLLPIIADPPQPFHSGRVFSMGIGGGTVLASTGNVPYHRDAIPVPSTSTLTGSANMYYVNQGESTYTVSGVSVFDESNGTNRFVIGDGIVGGNDDIPGASSSLVVHDGRLYVAVAFGDDRGVIRSFGLADLDIAYSRNTPLSWSDGIDFNSGQANNNSGAGMFFDARGYLFAGGTEGVTVFTTDGRVDSFDLFSGTYCSVYYNSFTDQFLAVPYDDEYDFGLVFNAADFAPSLVEPTPEPTTVVLLTMAAACLYFYRRRKST